MFEIDAKVVQLVVPYSGKVIKRRLNEELGEIEYEVESAPDADGHSHKIWFRTSQLKAV